MKSPIIFLIAAATAGQFSLCAQTIVLFGDSTTAKRGDLKVYADHLAEAKPGGKQTKVINAGVPGDHTVRARERFERDVLAHDPDLVVIQFGINDAAIDVWKDPPAKTSRVSLEDYRTQLVYFLDTLQSKGIAAVLMTSNPLRWNEKMRQMYGKPPYRPEVENGFEEPLLPYLGVVRELATERKIPLVDVHQEFSEFTKREGGRVDDLLLDGIHPNETGHGVVARALLPELRKSLAARRIASPPIHSEQWDRIADAVLFTDMTCVTPPEALSDRREHNRWKVFTYETSEYEGKCVSVGRESSAPDITFADGLEGWHAVYVGLSTITDLVRPAPNKIEARFSQDETFRRLSNRLDLAKPRRDRIEEVFLGVADLSDNDLVFSTVHALPARLHTIRAIPLTEAETKAVLAERERQDTRRMVATIDGFTWIHEYRPTTRAELASAFSALRHSDFGTWWFQPTGADLVNFPTEVGSIFGDTLDTFPRPADRDYTESVRLLHGKGIDPLQVAVEEAKKQNAQIFICLRAQGWKAAPPWEEFFRSQFYEDHPEWRCVDYDGTPTMHMSYAVEEVQDHLIDVYREALQRGGDGVGFLFHRGLPLMLWEKPFRERFEKRHGIDPLKVPEDDPRVGELRREIMSGFIAKIRKLLDEEQVRRGKNSPRLRFAASTFATRADNDRFGIDVEHWIREKWIDQIGIAWFAYYTSGLGKMTGDTEYYDRITEGTDVKVFPFYIGWKMPGASELVDRVAKDYREGADGIAVWDPFQFRGWADGGNHCYWPLVSQLGHREKLEDGSLLFLPRITPLTRVGGNHFSRWYPNTGF
jgi:lysophospholipase L1-like esterase